MAINVERAFCIWSETEAGFWSNDHGWSDIDDATWFSVDEVACVNVPEGGAWASLEVAAQLSRQRRIVITLDGGLVQDVYADPDAQCIIVDYDISDMPLLDDEDPTLIDEEAHVREEAVIPITYWPGTRSARLVAMAGLVPKEFADPPNVINQGDCGDQD